MKESTDCYCAAVGSREINVEFRYVEATNRPGADRQIVHINFPGFVCYFAAGTEGYYLVVKTLAAALEHWKSHISNYGNRALEFLDSLE